MVTGDDKYKEEIILDSTEGEADAVSAINGASIIALSPPISLNDFLKLSPLLNIHGNYNSRGVYDTCTNHSCMQCASSIATMHTLCCKAGSASNCLHSGNMIVSGDIKTENNCS